MTGGIRTPDVHPARMRWHEDLVTAVLAAWLVIDGWAHNTRPRLSTALLFGPLLFLLRRWRPPAGSAAITLGAQCLLMQAVTGFADARLAVLGLIGASSPEAEPEAADPPPRHQGARRPRRPAAGGPAG